MGVPRSGGGSGWAPIPFVEYPPSCRGGWFQRVAGLSLLHGYHPNPATPKTPTHIKTRTHDQCGDTIEKSQAPDDGCINVQNMLSLEEVK